MGGMVYDAEYVVAWKVWANIFGEDEKLLYKGCDRDVKVIE